MYFFAEDVFGGQFCIKDNKVHYFDTETAALEEMSDSLEGWAKLILSEYNLWTGYSLAHEWQKRNGALKSGYRLLPKIPFVCGGKYEHVNLVEMEIVSAMKFRADLANYVAYSEVKYGTKKN